MNNNKDFPSDYLADSRTENQPPTAVLRQAG